MQKLTFVRHMKGVSKESGKPYNFVVLSNGILTFNISPVDRELDLSQFEEGDEILCSFEVKPVQKGGSVTVYTNLSEVEEA